MHQAAEHLAVKIPAVLILQAEAPQEANKGMDFLKSLHKTGSAKRTGFFIVVTKP